MVEAYILLTSAIGKVRGVYEKLGNLESVKDARIVTGPFDLIVLAEAENLSTLTSTVVEEIREIDGVVDTNTAIVVE
ncbi:MAG: Lrp/AsnC ligand binding domain-containing protein [Candidatus Hadarchaeia archaeon]